VTSHKRTPNPKLNIFLLVETRSCWIRRWFQHVSSSSRWGVMTKRVPATTVAGVGIKGFKASSRSGVGVWKMWLHSSLAGSGDNDKVCPGANQFQSSCKNFCNAMLVGVKQSETDWNGFSDQRRHVSEMITGLGLDWTWIGLDPAYEFCWFCVGSDVKRNFWTSRLRLCFDFDFKFPKIFGLLLDSLFLGCFYGLWFDSFWGLWLKLFGLW